MSQSSSPYDVRVMWRARKRNTTAMVASIIKMTRDTVISGPRLSLSQGTAATHISRVLTMASGCDVINDYSHTLEPSWIVCDRIKSKRLTACI